MKSVIVLSAIEMITYSWSPTQSHIYGLEPSHMYELRPLTREERGLTMFKFKVHLVIGIRVSKEQIGACQNFQVTNFIV